MSRGLAGPVRRARALAAGLLLALAGCAGSAPDLGPGILLRTGGPNDCGYDRFEISVVGADGTVFGPEVYTTQPTELGDVSELELGDDTLSGLYAIGDLFVSLPEGTYTVTVTAQQENEPGVYYSVLANPPQQVVIAGGATTEIVQVFTCAGSTESGLDIVILVREAPDIVDFWYDPDKFTPVCGYSDMTAQFAYQDDVDLMVTWHVFAALGADGEPNPVSLLTSWTDPAPPSPEEGSLESTFRYECTTTGTRYVMVTVVDHAGTPTSFWSLVHCYEPLVGRFCLQDGELFDIGACSGVLRPVHEQCVIDQFALYEPDEVGACEDFCN